MNIAIIGAGVGGQACMDTLHLDPVAGAGHRGDEGLAVDDALSLQRDGLGEHR